MAFANSPCDGAPSWARKSARVIPSAYRSGNRRSTPKLPNRVTLLAMPASMLGVMNEVPRIGPHRPPTLYIREWITKRGLNQAQLAERMDTSAANVSRKLNAERKMKAEDLAWFAAALDCEPGDLFRHPDQPTIDELLRDATPEVRRQAVLVIRALKSEAG